MTERSFVGVLFFAVMRACLLSTLCATLGLTGCAVADGWGNFAHSITTDDHHGFQPTAHQVATGNFDKLGVLPSTGAGSIAVARHHDGSSATIALRDLDGGAGCDVVGTDYMLYDNVDAASSCIAVLDDPDGDGRGTLTFIDAQCTPLMVPLTNAMLPDTTYYPGKFLVQADPWLLVIQPQRGSIEVLARKLEAIDERVGAYFTQVHRQPPEWFIDGGTFKALDTEVVAYSYGMAVSEVVPLVDSSGHPEYAVVDNGDLVLVSNDGATPVAADACEAHAVDNAHIGYRQPCQGGKLKVSALSSPSEAVTIEATGLQILAFDGDYNQPSALITRASNDSGDNRDIYLTIKGGDAELVVSNATWVSSIYPAILYWDSFGNLRGQLEAIVNSDGLKGKLIWQNGIIENATADAGSVDFSSQILRTVADGVPITKDVSPFDWQLENYDGNVGDFRDPFNGNGQVLAQGVPANPGAYAYSNDYQFLLAQYSDGSGDLAALPALTDLNFMRSEQRTATWLAKRVGLGTFRYFDAMSAVSYIDQWDASLNSGRLVSHDFDYESDVYVAEHVREKIEITRPWVGVVYVVANGESQGIWVRHAN